MDRDDLQLVLLGLGTLGTFLIVFINLPQAIDRWVPIFSSLSPTILNWIQNLIIAGCSFTIGWFLKSSRTSNKIEPDIKSSNESTSKSTEPYQTSSPAGSGSIGSTDSTDTIEGCIEVGDTCWRGTAYLTENGEVSNTNLEYKAICPNCQTVMYDGENSSVAAATTATTYWDCPSCGHTTVEDYGKYSDAQNLFQSHIQRIVESDGEEYSLENLVKTTPRRVWEEYSEVVNDPQVSLNCFH